MTCQRPSTVRVRSKPEVTSYAVKLRSGPRTPEHMFRCIRRGGQRHTARDRLQHLAAKSRQPSVRARRRARLLHEVVRM